LAVIVPCHNEESGLARTVRSILACDDPVRPSDIIVAACNCTDRTVDIARTLGCTLIERIDPERRGKGYGLDNAFRVLAAGKHNAYLVVDADTVVGRNFLNEFRRLFAAGADAGQCVLRVANPATNVRTRLLNIAFLAITFLRPLARKRLGISCGLFGNGFGLSAATVQAVPYQCYSIAEDLEYHVALVRAGKFVDFLEDTSVFAEMCTTGEAARPQRERWEGGRFRVLIDGFPGLLDDICRGRARALEPLLDLVLLPLAYHVTLLLTLALIASGPSFAYAMSGLLLVIVHVMAAMVLGNLKSDDWWALAALPLYVGWKFVNLGGVLKSIRRTTPWRRTSRSHQPP
jgi:cellulose synthase/poly-beta-1,6-N-acetylglucosamine synthase-like glycosyltransferase